MTFKVYEASVGKKLSAVKRKILERLWNEGASFPRGWVSSSELLKLTDQKYFDRRIRELRDELGCDIETGALGKDSTYRLVSTSLASKKPRAYLPPSAKTQLFVAANNRCAVCSQQFKPGLSGLQADHRIPLNRGGQNVLANFQALCTECNVGKRRVCAGCTLNCKACSWAFPEKMGRRLILQLPRTVENSLQGYMDATGFSLDKCVQEAVIRFLVSRKGQP